MCQIHLSALPTIPSDEKCGTFFVAIFHYIL